MSHMKKILFITVFVVTLSGCGMMDGKDILSKLDSSEVTDNAVVETTAKVEETQTDTSTVSEEKTVTRELYLLDKDGYVVPQTVQLPQTNSAAKQALEYLVEDGPVTDLLPSGFKAVLPAGTELTVDVQKDTAVVDFSSEMKEYKAKDEQKILQAITWTLTQFDTIKNVKIKIDGYDQTSMPVANTPIGSGLSRADGINFDKGNAVDITNTKAVTLYFLSQNTEGNTYYVPVTRRVENTKEDVVQTVVKELVKGPETYSNLNTEFDPDVELLDEETNNGVVTLNFNEFILENSTENTISSNVLQSLVLSLTEQNGVNSVSIKVNGNEEIMNDSGELLTREATRPEMVNTGKY